MSIPLGVLFCRSIPKSIPRAHNLAFANRNPGSSQMIEPADYEEIPGLTLRRLNSTANHYSLKENESYMTTPLSEDGNNEYSLVRGEGLYDN